MDGEAFGVEPEAAAVGAAVEAVALDGTAESGGMGGVDAQLVGAARLGGESDIYFSVR